MLNSEKYRDTRGCQSGVPVSKNEERNRKKTRADSQIRIGEMGRIVPTRFHDESELRVDVFYRCIVD
jgi:hypothetical protein